VSALADEGPISPPAPWPFKATSSDAWQVEAPCPQCGAPVELAETDRLLTCEYCRVRLLVAGEGPTRFCLPPTHAEVGEVVMVPYWRVRGMHYRCIPWEVRESILDLSRLAAAAPDAPATLGVRPQAVRMRFAAPEQAARFLPVTLPPPLDAAVARTAGAADGARLFFAATVATTSSIVYLPVRLSGGVFDALVNRRLGSMTAETWLARTGGAPDLPSPVRFVATLCPSCGWQLNAERDSLVLLCGQCGAGWHVGAAGLDAIDYDVVPSDGWSPATHLPLWRLTARVDGAPLDSWADLVRFANLPLVVRPEWEKAPLEFVLPAFRCHPEQYLRIGRILTLARLGQPTEAAEGRGTTSGEAADLRTHAVTLPASALTDAVKVLLADLGQPKSRLFPRLSSISVRVTGSRLTYLPLAFSGTEYVHPSLHVSVQRAILERG
jgi:DNA-directed RNA polymerase subunit RPC12/RpoP